MTNSQAKSSNELQERLDKLIEEMEYHKKIKDLQKNYYVVLEEMKNLRDGRPIGS